jgi:hypothetical protein
MNRFLLAFALTATLGAPALAEGMAQDMTCSDFMAMGQDDMMAATTEAMAADAMSEDGAMATDSTTSGDAMATEGMMSADDQMAAMVKACTEHPEMTAMDAINMMQ